MLNMQRLREYADYSCNPELAPNPQISGREAFQKYDEEAFDNLLAQLPEGATEFWKP